MNPLCIYHANCADGFTAAWVVRKFYDSQVDFHPGVYQEPPPDVTGRNVILVDFSYKRQVIQEMATVANSILILDHHKSAMEDLKALGLENVYKIFDMERSGAMITWDWYFGSTGTPMPLLLPIIQDRDLWRFALPGTREIHACVFSFPYEFLVWDVLMTQDADGLARFALNGSAIERKHFKDIRELLAVVTRRMTIGGYDVPVANLPYTMSSDAGHIMGKGERFAACYWDTPKGRVFSLRSAEDGVDVSEVAVKYGGGGHRHAAGFTVSHDDDETWLQLIGQKGTL